MTTKQIPANLAPAYDWTSAAGELEELASLEGEALDIYCRESAANATEHGERDVDEADLSALASWLRANG